MNAAQALSRLASGERPPSEGLLHTALLEGWGSQAYGEEAVLEAVRAAPAAGADWDVVAGPSGVALFGDDVALFGDALDGRLQRVWRLGPGSRLPRQPAVFVSFDPDLTQARGDVLVGDTGIDAEIVTAAARLVSAALSGFRTRVFALRGIADGSDLALLFAVYRMTDRPVRSCGFSYAAARLRVVNGSIADARIVRDLAGEAAVAETPLVPRL